GTELLCPYGVSCPVHDPVRTDRHDPSMTRWGLPKPGGEITVLIHHLGALRRWRQLFGFGSRSSGDLLGDDLGRNAPSTDHRGTSDATPTASGPTTYWLSRDTVPCELPARRIPTSSRRGDWGRYLLRASRAVTEQARFTGGSVL